MICCALLCGCAATTPTDLSKPKVLAPQVLNKVEAAELTVINASGWTLTPSNDNILDNGILLVSLPRQTYQKILINPGPHEFRFDHSPNGRRVAKLNAERGGDYYLLTAYDPSRGGLLLAIQGDPMVIRMIDAQDAQVLKSKMVPK
jgi:hypothetical protein